MVLKILVALDTSERAEGVLEAAVQYGERLGAVLFVLRVVTVPPEFPAAAAGTASDPLPAHLAGEAMQALVALTEPVARRAKIGAPLVRLGEPGTVILEVAKERDVDLIVVGSHGVKGWDRVLGTTAGKVATHADRNVLVVHARSVGAR